MAVHCGTIILLYLHYSQFLIFRTFEGIDDNVTLVILRMSRHMETGFSCLDFVCLMTRMGRIEEFQKKSLLNTDFTSDKSTSMPNSPKYEENGSTSFRVSGSGEGIQTHL